MKKEHLILILMSILISHNTFSQSLLIKGFFKNTNEENILANYQLLSNNKVISNGTVKKLKIELLLNTDFTLIISKKGYESKSICFSTHTKDEKEFYFEFDVCLKEDSTNKEISTPITSYIFYDDNTKGFNYTTNKKHLTQY
jgi:hypothetical protein